MAAHLSRDPSHDVHRHAGGLGELRVDVDGTTVVDTSRLWYPTPRSVIEKVETFLASSAAR